MAPKKNVNKTPTLEKKALEKKTPKPRMKKEKAKLRIPSVIKLKIPATTLNKTVKKESAKNIAPKNKAAAKLSTTKFSKKQLDTLAKLELANEVARAQLLNIPVAVDKVTSPPTTATKKSEKGKKRGCAKKTPQIEKPTAIDTTVSCPSDSEEARAQLLNIPVVVDEVSTTPTTASKKSEKGKKRGCSKKAPQIEKTIATDTTVSCLTDSEEAFDMAPKKKKYVRKVPYAQVKKKPIVKRNNKVTVKTTNELPKKKMKQTKITDLNTGIESSLKTSVKYSNKPVKKKTTTETKPRTRRPLIRKGKPDADTTSTSDVQKSPSLLEQLENKSPKIENVVSNESPVKENLEACTIGSRKTSTTGVSECLSWTKDISSSSTVTSLTASSNDFVRIDKKIPILKLTNIDNQIKVETLNNPQPSSDAGSSSSSSSGSNSSESTLNRDARSLDLSTSSVTPTKSRNSNGNSEANNHINYITALDRLTAKLKTFDLEIINWIGYDETDLNMDIKKFQDNVFRILKEESQVITHCQRLKQVLSDNNQEDNANDLNNREQTAENTGNSDIVIPVNANRNNILGQGIRNDDSVGNNNNLIGELKSPSKVVNDNTNGNGNNFTSEKYRYTNFENNYDDDDALSLFAESITGIESSRLNSSTASVMSIANNSTGHFEEYIPQPLSREQWDSVNKISYIPSKIVNTDVQSLDNKKTICEKHRADSTSITKDVELDKNEIPLNIENNLNTTEKVFNQHDQCTIIEKKKMPCLMSSLFKSLHGIKSIVFRGMCFFYLISSCKNPRCRFPHVKPDLNEISSKLVRLSEEVFIQEYMLLRNWPDLRRKYGMCFVEECKRRELTRFLVEMAIDFYMKANENYIEDCNLRVIVMECTLLYLNTVNLATCEDLLLFNVQQDLLLCDVFMKTIADTQNFSRFKQVFINLTNFIVHHDKTFNLDVGTQILERVCILPYEQSLTEALIEMISHTDQVIFDNSMIGIFEKQLSSKNKDLYEKFLACKQAKLERPMSKNPEIPPCINPDVEPVINTSLIHTEREKRYTSPDTTNLDNTNKSTDEPIFTRTIDFNRVRNIGVNIQRSFSNSNSTISNDSTEESGPQITPVPTPNFQTWKGQTVFNKFRNYSRAAPPQGSYQRPPLIKRRIHQLPNFGPSPSKLSRRSGPDFY